MSTIESKKKVKPPDPLAQFTDIKGEEDVVDIGKDKPITPLALAPLPQLKVATADLEKAFLNLEGSKWRAAIECGRFRDLVNTLPADEKGKKPSYQKLVLECLAKAGITGYSSSLISQLADAGSYILRHNLADVTTLNDLPFWTAVRPMYKLEVLDEELKVDVQEDIEKLHDKLFVKKVELTVKDVTEEVNQILRRANDGESEAGKPSTPNSLNFDKLKLWVEQRGAKIHRVKKLTKERLLEIVEANKERKVFLVVC